MNYNTFKFYTNTLKAVKDDNARYIVGVASSTGIDRDGDRMSEAALQTMKSTAEANLTIFTNHEYRVPDDLFGSCTDATIKAKKDQSPIVVKSEDGENEIATFSPQEMEIRIKVVSDAVNPKAGQIYKAIEEGINLGFSIGGVVKNAVKVFDEATQKLCNLIDAIDLYEISIVSIPANPDAMNLAISKSLSSKKSDKASDKEEIVEIIKKIENTKEKEVEYTLEGVHKFLTEILKKYYDEMGTEVHAPDLYVVPDNQDVDLYRPDNDVSKEEKREEYEQKLKCERRQSAKALAENVLMKAGVDAKVDNSDWHELHLRSHAFVMDYLLSEGFDVSRFASHVEAHLKKLKKIITDNKGEKEEKNPPMTT